MRPSTPSTSTTSCSICSTTLSIAEWASGRPGTKQLPPRIRFRIGDVFPADDPVARFLVAIAATLNDTLLANRRFVAAEQPFESIYFFNLASSHLYEAAEVFYRADREWPEVRALVQALDDDSQGRFARIAALAAPNADWPGPRLKELRNSFFHYLRLDRAAAEAGRLPIRGAIEAAADMDGLLILAPPNEVGIPIIRSFFADEVLIKAITLDYEDGESERLIATLANYQGDLNKFSQVALGRYFREQQEGVVTHDQIVVELGDRPDA